MVPMMSVIEIVNCTTTNALRGNEASRPVLKVPFNTFTGWKEDKNNAGYNPANKPVTTLKPIPTSQNVGSDHRIAIFLSAISLNFGRISTTINSANKNANTDTMTDSLKNCVIN